MDRSRLWAGVALALIGLVAPREAAPAEEKQEKKAGERPLILSTNPNLEVKLSGRIHRMVQIVDDGAEVGTGVFFTDSAQGPTMLRFDVTGQASESLSVGGSLEDRGPAEQPHLREPGRPGRGHRRLRPRCRARARSVGAMVLQSWDRFGVRFYGSIRRYSVDRSDTPLEPMTLLPFGVLVTF